MIIAQPGFLPVRLPELRLWLAADRSAKTFNGGNISQWNDLSGNGHHATQSVASNQPLFVSNGINGLPTMRFDGTNDYFNIPTPSALGIQNADYEIFFVASSSSASIQFLLAGAIGEYEFHFNPGVGLRYIPAGSDFADLGSMGDFTDGAPHLLGARVASDIAIIRADGVDSGDTVTPGRSSDNTALRIGIRSSNTNALNGDIPEVVICQPSLSTQSRGFLESYMNRKYGI